VLFSPELILATLELSDPPTPCCPPREQEVSRVLEFNWSTTVSSLHADTPTMMVLPITLPFLPTALLACNLVWNLMCIQLLLGGMICCSTVPHPDICCTTKLAAEGGKPHTVTQVERGSEGGLEGVMSWGGNTESDNPGLVGVI